LSPWSITKVVRLETADGEGKRRGIVPKQIYQRGRGKESRQRNVTKRLRNVPAEKGAKRVPTSLEQVRCGGRNS